MPQHKREGGLGGALIHMEEALHILDAAGAPGHIGARLDHALCDLREVIGNAKSKSAKPFLQPTVRQQ